MLRHNGIEEEDEVVRLLSVIRQCEDSLVETWTYSNYFLSGNLGSRKDQRLQADARGTNALLTHNGIEYDGIDNHLKPQRLLMFSTTYSRVRLRRQRIVL